MSKALPIVEYRLTDHARFEMARRQIPEVEIARALSSPDQIEIVLPGRAVYQSQYNLESPCVPI